MAKPVAPARRHHAVLKRKGAVKSIKHAKGADVVKKRKPEVLPGISKIRIGIIHGRHHDPVKIGTHDRNYPEHLKVKNNTGPHASGWGGQFHADVDVGLKVARLHPDIFEIDFMSMREVTEARLVRNHLTFNFWGCICVALNAGDRKLAKRLEKVQRNPDTRHVPAWDYYDWNMHKMTYMKALEKVRIPIIPTIYVQNEFNARAVLKQVVAKGWDRFFVKPSYMGMFGEGATKGITQELLEDIRPLLKFEKECGNMREFLVQPYVTKPNGNVFDEIRNFLIDGEWAYSVYTDGTDEDGVWEQPPGPLKEACKELSLRAYEEVKKVHTWEGKRIDTLLSRIDVGFVPDTTQKLGYRIFVNEVEPQLATWLARYCPFRLQDRLAEVMVAHTRRMLKLSLDAGRKVPNSDEVRSLLELLDQRLGPLAG